MGESFPILWSILIRFAEVILICVEAVFAFPFGYYSLYRKEEMISKEVILYGDTGSPYTEVEMHWLYHRIPFWPRIFGRDVWLYAAIPPLLLAHFKYSLEWVPSILIGLVGAVLVPFISGLLTLKTKLT